MELVAIRVTIKRQSFGNRVVNKWPNFNEIDAVIRGSLDWSHYIDAHGLGWHYDQVAPFGQSDEVSTSPVEMFAVTAVPAAFADAAVALFPNEVVLLDEAGLMAFYDDRAHTNDSAEIIDVDIVAAIRQKYAIVGRINSVANLALMDPEDRRAVDPTDEKPGIVNNPHRLWALTKGRRNVTIRPLPPSPSPRDR